LQQTSKKHQEITMKIDMLVFGEDWGAHPSSTQHLINQHNSPEEILWVNSLGLRRPKFNQYDMLRAFRKILSMQQAPQQKTTSQLRQLNPQCFSWPGNSHIRQLNRKLLLRQLRPLLNNSPSPLIWTSLPSAVDVIGHLNERACVYYCGDDFSALAGVDHQPVQAMEDELVDKSQLVIAASEHLAQKFPKHKTLVLNHGVDYKHFATTTTVADDLAKGLTAGFYGSISSWFDQALVCQVAKLLPHWKFVLIGPVQTDVSALQAMPNIELLGARPYSQLPRYSQHWYAGILPFKDNRQIQACNPLKLREYLAAGRPIVSTPFPALEPYRELIHVAQRAEQFASALEESVRCQSEEHKEARQLSVQTQDWKHKATQVSEVLAQL